jgi:hypothetical protein
MKKAVFILSLPRAGSTLLLRMLLRHPDVRGMSEGWFLLPAFFAARRHGTFSVYRHDYSSRAIAEMIAAMPSGRQDMYDAVRAYAEVLYDRIGGGATHVVDKTPPYSLIVGELMETFPDAYFIFLWRDPVSVISSFINVDPRKRFTVENIRAELYGGLARLCQESRRTDRRILNVKYEDLSVDGEAVLKRISGFLGLREDAELAGLAEVSVPGTLGDPGALRTSGAVIGGRDGGRAGALRSIIRKRFMLSYLDWIGKERLFQMGYDLAALKEEVRSVKASLRFLPGDCGRLVYPKLNSLLLLTAIRANVRDAIRGCALYNVD